MLTPEYKRDVNKNYLILRVEDDLDTQSYQVRMLMTGTVPGLLSCRLQNMDSRMDAWYDITSRQQLSSLFEGKKLSYADLQLIFGGFVKVMETAAEYLLNPDMLILKPDYMYVDAGQKELYFCCLPGYDESIRTQFQGLTEYLLPRLDHEDQRAVMLGYGVYRRAMDDTFHLEQIKEELYRHREEPAPVPYRTPERSAEFSENQEPFIPSADIRRTFFTKKNDTPAPPSGERYPTDPLPVYEKSLAPADSSPSPGLKHGRWILQSVLVILGAAVVAALAAAKYLGYLPQIPIVLILGAGTAILALLVVFSLVRTKKQKSNEPEMLDGLLARRREEAYAGSAPDGKPAPESRSATEYRSVPDSRSAFTPWGAGSLESAEGSASSISGFTAAAKGTAPDADARGQDAAPVWQGEDLAPASHRSESTETIVLTAASVIGPASLVSREPGELATIYLAEDLTVIGKLPNAADALIDLPTVSRVHAKIRRRGEEYYLTDLNSRNGTCVNGKMLQAEEDYLLQDQDEVDFAQARYVFLK